MTMDFNIRLTFGISLSPQVLVDVPAFIYIGRGRSAGGKQGHVTQRNLLQRQEQVSGDSQILQVPAQALGDRADLIL